MSTKENIIKYLKGELSKEEKEVFISNLYSDEALKKEFFRHKDVWDYSGMQLDAYPYNKELEWSEIKRRIKPAVTKKIWLNNWLKIATVAAVAIIAYFIGQWHIDDYNVNEAVLGEHCIEVPVGQISRVTLADGSKVVLNSGSKLILPRDFGVVDRAVELDGEGYFEVIEDQDRVFNVKSGDQEVRVLGTKFNIRAYPDEALYETKLLEGAVEWTSDNMQKKYTLKPGDEIKYNVQSGVIKKSHDLNSYVAAWTEGRYEFKKATFKKIADVIKKYYDVEIVYDEEYFKNKHYNGVVRLSRSLDETMQVIALMVGVKYKITGKKVIIKKIS